jgi:hypothetical protein
MNPFAVWAFKMSGGSTSDTALALRRPSPRRHPAAQRSRPPRTWSSPTFDEGVTWGYTGANAGRFRKVTSVSSPPAP